MKLLDAGDAVIEVRQIKLNIPNLGILDAQNAVFKQIFGKIGL
jgi:hypothetical protein